MLSGGREWECKIGPLEAHLAKRITSVLLGSRPLSAHQKSLSLGWAPGD